MCSLSLRFPVLLLQLNVQFNLPPIWAGIIGLAINYSAYEAENYRAGLLAIPRGQMEAALALGMNPFTALRVVIVPQAQEAKEVGEDDVLEATLDAGAEEVNDLGEAFEVISEATDLVAVRTALQAAGLDYDSAEVQFVPSMNVELDRDSAGKVFRLVEALEDLDDVQNVFGNFDVSDEVLEALDA